MSLRPFSSNIESLKGQAATFDYESAAMMAPLQGHQVNVDVVEGSHRRIMEVYTKTMQEIANLKSDIVRQTNYSNQEEMFSTAESATGIETRLQSALNRLNDNVLTYYPTAKIEYGAACIGPQIAPFIQGLNAKEDARLIAMLSNCSSIREIRGDGNCFISAFTTRFLETLVERKAVDSFIAFILEDGIDEPLLKEEILNTLAYLQTYPSQKEAILGDNRKILPFINYFRLIAADEMEKNSDQFETFFRSDIEQVFGGEIDGKSYHDLISKYVHAMGTDFSHPMITALCQRLQFPVRIIDARLGAADGFNTLDDQVPQGTFCRKGAHYFVLYTTGEATPIAPKSVAPIIQVKETPKPTEMLIKCKVPFGHNLFIRGSANGLNWEKGTPLIEIDEDTWIFRSAIALNDMEYKFLFDDSIWENGNNHKISQGKVDGANPQFNLPSNLEIQDKPMAPVKTTRITIKCDAGVGNKLFIRGAGPGMNWEKGLELKNVGGDIWVFETQADFPHLEYKILLNDTRWELDNNHKTDCGKKEEVIPRF